MRGILVFLEFLWRKGSSKGR